MSKMVAFGIFFYDLESMELILVKNNGKSCCKNCCFLLSISDPEVYT